MLSLKVNARTICSRTPRPSPRSPSRLRVRKWCLRAMTPVYGFGRSRNGVARRKSLVIALCVGKACAASCGVVMGDGLLVEAGMESLRCLRGIGRAGDGEGCMMGTGFWGFASCIFSMYYLFSGLG